MKKLALLLSLTLLSSCAAWGYAYWGIDWEEQSQDIKLFDPEGNRDDISFLECKPTLTDKGRCVVIKRSEFFKIKRDMEAMRIRIKELEKACLPPTP